MSLAITTRLPPRVTEPVSFISFLASASWACATSGSSPTSTRKLSCWVFTNRFKVASLQASFLEGVPALGSADQEPAQCPHAEGDEGPTHETTPHTDEGLPRLRPTRNSALDLPP